MTTILDDPVQMQALDPDNMMAYLQALPTDLLKAWRIGGEQNLPPLGNIRQVIISGMGGLPLERIWRLPTLLTQGWFLCMFTVITDYHPGCRVRRPW